MAGTAVIGGSRQTPDRPVIKIPEFPSAACRHYRGNVRRNTRMMRGSVESHARAIPLRAECQKPYNLFVIPTSLRFSDFSREGEWLRWIWIARVPAHQGIDATRRFR